MTSMEYKGVSMLTAALEENGRICQINPMGMSGKCILGNIYIGKVKNIVKNIHAAFVEIADGQMCYYSMDEKELPVFASPGKHEKVKSGDELVVQVAREGMKTKLPYVTGNLNFTGHYLVLTSHRRELGFSGKLTKAEKQQFRQLLEEYMPLNAGIIVRTNCRGAKAEEILKELEELKERYEMVLQKGSSRVCFSLLEESIPEYMQILQNVYTQNLEEIVTDDRNLYERISQYARTAFPENTAIRLYEDKLLPLYKLYSLESVLEHALHERVWLKSGGFLVIQQTEAFVCIDVNTGKYTSNKEMEETFRKMNQEAAAEIAVQLRLRNLSGIILIDFINMKDQNHKKELLENLQAYLNRDPVKGTVVDMTSLNIVEVTRKKVRRPLQEEMRELIKEAFL